MEAIAGLTRCCQSELMGSSESTMLDDDQKLWAYLSFGYLPIADRPRPLGILENWTGEPQQVQAENNLEAAISAAMRLVASMVVPMTSHNEAATHVVLLSGGFDSRAILASLLEVVPSSRVVACTYGYKGNEEYELAARAAKIAGVEHLQLQINKTHWTTNELVESVLTRSFPPSFVIGARFQNFRIYRHFGDDCVFWDGFLGGSLTGALVRPDAADPDWPHALQRFLRWNSQGRRLLTPPEYDPLTALPRKPFCSPEVLGFDDQLNLGIRQTCYISNRLPSDYKTGTPFADEASWRFWLGLPPSFRRHQLVYKEALRRAYPKLFSIPVAGGRSAVEASPWQSKVNSFRRRASSRVARALGRRLPLANPHGALGDQMRENASLRSVIDENIADLDQRKLITWASPARIWSDHRSGKVNNTDAIRILVSLEIGLKAELRKKA